MIGKKRDPSPVLGGSITRSPEGRLQTLQTHGQYPTPTTVQEVWTFASRKRYPKAWEGERLADVGHVIEWEPRRIACICGRSLGNYVAYRIRHPLGQQLEVEEHGVIEKTPHRYGYTSERMHDGNRNKRSKPRFRIDREIGHRARKTTAYFHCRGCGRTHERNLHRLGQTVFESPPGRTFVLE